MERERYFEATEFENIKGIIYNSAKKYADKTAFIIKHKNKKEVEYENISYARFLEEINALGTKFFEMGLKDKRIAIVGRNRYEWVLTHLTNLTGGIVSVPLDKELQADELESCLSRSKADVVVFDEKYLQIIEEIKNKNNTSLQEYISMGKQEGYKDILGLVEEGKKLVNDGNKDYIESEIDSDKMGLLLFTSGTTSKSKAVMLSQRNLASNIYALQLVEPITSEDVNLLFLPLHHIFGATGMMVMVSQGVANAFPDGLRYVAQNLKEYKVTIFVGVPLLIEAIYKKIEQGIEKKGKTKVINIAKKISNLLMFFHIDIRRKLFKQVIDELGGHMRFIISGGAPLDKKVAKGLNELGIKLAQGYGLTETAPVVSAENAKKYRYGSIGVPMENVEVEFVDKDENGIGELRVKGPNVMLGYYENPEETKKVLQDGWFYTGDLGYMDKDGYVFITGRKKDMIVLKNGKKVFPEEIETLVNRIDEVSECMVFGIPEENDKNDLKLSVKVVYDAEFVKEHYTNIENSELEKIIWQKIMKLKFQKR
ncbi:MAG: AMP-binding protein [Clostridia bacterium]|nr:AMP-binding protein [Clostridia bacterium]